MPKTKRKPRYWPHFHPRLREGDTVYYIDNGPEDTGTVRMASRRHAFVLFDNETVGDWYAPAQLMLVRSGDDTDE